jgi:hypothetical protein
MPDAAMRAQPMKESVCDEAHQHQGAEPQDDHFRHGILLLQAEQDGEGEEHAEPGKHRPTGPGILEVDVRQHRTQHAGQRDGHQILGRHHVGRQRHGCQCSADNGADRDMGGEIGHFGMPPSGSQTHANR